MEDWPHSSDPGETELADAQAAPRITAFALLSPRDDPMPSTRIACLNLFPYLSAAGLAPEVRWEPSAPTEIPSTITVEALLGNSLPRVVVLQKIRGPAVVKVVRALRARGIRCIWCVCDIVDNEMVAETDATLAVTRHLRSLYAPELQPRIHVVHDGVEDESLVSASVADAAPRPTALLVTSSELYELPVITLAPPGWRVRVVGRYAESRRRRLREMLWSLGRSDVRRVIRALPALCDPRISRIGWSKSRLAHAVTSAQIGIIPIEGVDSDRAPGSSEPSWRVKSENRLTLLMAAGLPVVASPIPSYEEVVVHGVNGFLAASAADWRRHLHALRDPHLRQEIGARARAAVLPKFSKDLQAERFIAIVRQVAK
jgi:glycosyltransferase involved in cell wall biosynthesis